jgi:caffeoyl-CoA O-methyltransferase
MDDSLEQYILSHIDEEPEILRQLNRNTQVNFLNGRMVSGHLQGRLLVMLTKMIKPGRVLELGTFTGYSAICFAEGTDTEAEIHTIEINEELEESILEWFDKAGVSKKIHLHIGDALDIVPKLDGLFDLAFIDLEKRDYTVCYETVFPKVKPGGFILADNTLWYGKILGEIDPGDSQSLAISKFNDYIANDSRVEKVILPLRDGLTILRKKY